MADETPATPLTITGNFPAAYVGVAYEFTPTVAGGDNTKYAFSATGLPAGITVDATTGAVSGTPTAAGSDGVTLTVTDGTTTQKLTGVIAVAPQISIQGEPGSAVVGTPYSFKPTIANAAADGKVVVTLANGAFLPTGLSLNADTGEVSGTPTEAKAAGFTLDVTDGHTTNKASFTITVGPALAIVDNLDISLSLDVFYSKQLQTTGGSGGNVFWELIDGAFPLGMKLSSVGLIEGTPTEAGDYTIHVKASTADKASADEIFEFSVLDDGKAESDGKTPDVVHIESALGSAVAILGATTSPTAGERANIWFGLTQAILITSRCAAKANLDAVKNIIAANLDLFEPETIAACTVDLNPTQAATVTTFYKEFYNALAKKDTTVLDVTALIRTVRRMDVVMYLKLLRS